MEMENGRWWIESVESALSGKVGKVGGIERR